MFMAAGFAMLESGLVRSKNTATICLKNIALYAIAGIMYYLLGYDLMYTDVSGYIGSFSFLYDTSAAELALLNADEATPALIAAVTENGYSVMSDWFFQMVFVATAASIVSGTLAERIKLWPFLIFAAILSAIIYPIQGSWTWGGGWLSSCVAMLLSIDWPPPTGSVIAASTLTIMGGSETLAMSGSWPGAVVS